ncbi:MAG: transketolase, partial [Candidatus Lambdaproteobacteria bacterium]|nr:transketolase [Candidatus Lambdaproteobacteria bacterium]
MSTPEISPQQLPQFAAHALRFLAMDAVQQANSGHPGMPMGMADAATVLWRDFLRHNPANPRWFNRDRFVLSGGHGSMLLYGLLHLSGYDLPLEELRKFRQLHSRTPGHPEFGHTPGVEVTTGPLGQGISMAVGMALAERWLAARFNRPGHDLVDHYTYVIATDGDMQEGVSHEACSLGGHLGLGRLIVLYDDNHISIDGPTSLSFSENVAARFKGYGWHVQAVDGLDPAAVTRALKAARRVAGKPSLIVCRTTIGYGAPHLAGSEKTHGSPLGADEVAATRQALTWPWPAFEVPGTVLDYWREARAKGAKAEAAWTRKLKAYRAAFPQEAADLERIAAGEPAQGWQAPLDALRRQWDVEPPKAEATRVASGAVLEAVAMGHADLLGGSADLTPSNNTRVKAFADIAPASHGGRYVRYGVREHGMGAVMNGLARHGGVVPYAGTFLVFSDYMRPAIRLACLSHAHVVHVFTHDSIGLGEDGPTH